MTRTHWWTLSAVLSLALTGAAQAQCSGSSCPHSPCTGTYPPAPAGEDEDVAKDEDTGKDEEAAVDEDAIEDEAKCTCDNCECKDGKCECKNCKCAKCTKEKEIERCLNETITIEFKDAPLSKVIDDLRSLKNMNIVIDRAALEDEGIDINQAITEKLEGISMKSVLKILLNRAGLTYIVADGALQITTKQHGHGKCATAKASKCDCGKCKCGCEKCKCSKAAAAKSGCCTNGCCAKGSCSNGCCTKMAAMVTAQAKDADKATGESEYVSIVLEDLTINYFGAGVNIKKIKVRYKGQGLEAGEVAKDLSSIGRAPAPYCPVPCFARPVARIPAAR